ncbi:MAG: methylated-DNA--[protein]-cysteine S-methyltransferase [Verrucomicrobiota bacterium]|nr:methylated-DNA--[protein]-cysteine S-methyltransferase [Verrucomicrobiota bacterium]
MTSIRLLHTSEGTFIARFTRQGLQSLDFPSQNVPDETGTVPEAWVRKTHAAIQSILEGAQPVEMPPLDLHGTEFQKAVWAAMSRIPLGNTRSYQELARELGRPTASRAIGQACGANPVPLLIPCHRVLGAGKKLCGFSGGLNWKRLLLSRELVQFS